MKIDSNTYALTPISNRTKRTDCQNFPPISYDHKPYFSTNASDYIIAATKFWKVLKINFNFLLVKTNRSIAPSKKEGQF